MHFLTITSLYQAQEGVINTETLELRESINGPKHLWRACWLPAQVGCRWQKGSGTLMDGSGFEWLS